jgi:predicted pyridoxine 5'-phosphate oxidase superfamily flavin-nucleotide-binding protein
MAHKYLDVVTTPSVRAAQTRYYGRSIETGGAPERDPLGEDERAFIAARDSFYIASVGETGWPYIQHRGGTAGFLKVLGPHSLGFCDYRGNRQMITTGNVAGNDRQRSIITPHADN